MGKINTHFHGFNVGEKSAAGLARIDQERVRLASEIQENLLPHTIGKGLVRPGTKYLGNSASNAQARILPFVKSTTAKALLELTDSVLRVWVDDALVTRASVTSTVDNGTFSKPSATVTITIASPAVISWTGHGFSAGQAVTFKTTGALPTGITAGTTYYVISTGLATNSFRISTTAGGSAVNTSGTQSGTHTGDASWVTTVTGGATSTVGSSRLTMACTAIGGTALAKQQVATSSSGTVHALRIVVDRGPVTFRCGSADGTDDYIAETTLDVGTHSLAFTPSGSSFYVQFFTRSDIEVRVSQCSVESAGVMTLTAPWVTADLREIRVEQSLDVMFLAHAAWQQRKIERRGDASWSLTLYAATDGPFSTTRTRDVQLTPSARNGNITITADRPFFSSDHVGALFKLTYAAQGVLRSLAAVDATSEAIKIVGIGSDRGFIYNLIGTFVGTVVIERSYESADTGFVTVASFTAPASSVISDGLDNVDVWYRWRCSAYTSGIMTASIIAGSSGGDSGIVRITGRTSSTSVSAEVLKSISFVSSAATSDWQEGKWSDFNGWPSAVAFFDGRLWWAAGDEFWGSESDSFYAFNLDTEGDAGSIQRSIATGGSSNNARWMLPLQRLIFGTDGAESSARASSFDEPLTPTNLTLKDASTQGSAAISPVKIDGRGLFVQRSGVRVYELAYDIQANDYTTTNMMRLNEDIGGDGIYEIAVQRQPEPYIWTVRADGQCPILLYNPAEQVAGWVRWIGGASAAGDAVIESVCVLPTNSRQDRVYLSVKRTINGSVVRFIERVAFHNSATGSTTNTMADAHVIYTGPVTTCTGLSHLEGETVVAWGNSKPLGSYTVSGGQITLSESATNVCVGLSYSWRYKSSKLAYGSQLGTALLQPKKISQLGLLLANTHPDAISFGPDFTTMDPMPRVENGSAITTSDFYTTYDEMAFPFPGGWDTDARLCLSGAAPYPCTLLGLVMTIEEHDK